MEPLHVFVAVAPLAIYLGLLGIFLLRGRPFMMNGSQDAATIGIAVIGFFLVGPADLFMPERAVLRFHAYVWVLIVLAYAVSLSLVVLMLRPRLVFYNIRIEDLRPILSEILTTLDDQTRWAGDCAVLPNLQVQLGIERTPYFPTLQITSVGGEQSQEGWARIEHALRGHLRKNGRKQNSRALAFVLMALGATLLVSSGSWVYFDQTHVSEMLTELLRLPE